MNLTNEEITKFVNDYRWQFRWDHHGLWRLDFQSCSILVYEDDFTIEYDGDTLTWTVPGLGDIFEQHQIKNVVRAIKQHAESYLTTQDSEVDQDYESGFAEGVEEAIDTLRPVLLQAHHAIHHALGETSDDKELVVRLNKALYVLQYELGLIVDPDEETYKDASTGWEQT